MVFGLGFLAGASGVAALAALAMTSLRFASSPLDSDKNSSRQLKLLTVSLSIKAGLNASKVNRPEIVGDSTLQENTTMKTRNYTPEMKERAVRMLIEAKDDYPSTWSAIKAIAPKIGCTPETLRSWHKKHIDQTIPASVQAQSQAERIKELERECRELKQANEIIRKAAAFFAQAELDRKPK